MKETFKILLMVGVVAAAWAQWFAYKKGLSDGKKMSKGAGKYNKNVSQK